MQKELHSIKSHHNDHHQHKNHHDHDEDDQQKVSRCEMRWQNGKDLVWSGCSGFADADADADHHTMHILKSNKKHENMKK